MPSLATTVKSFTQLGFQPLALYALYKLGLKMGYFRWVTKDHRRAMVNGQHLTAIRPVFSLPIREQLQEILGEEGKSLLLKEADEIIAGKVRLFGGEPVQLQLTLNQPLQHWTAYEINHNLLSAFHFPHNDIKFLWEPARFGWVYNLGRAYALTQDNIYAEAFWKYFEQFSDGNPPYLGPHWMNGQELGIRLMSLVWAVQVFEEAPATNSGRSERLIQSIQQHASRIMPTLTYARAQNNNHLVTEAAALFTAGVALGHRKWRASGWHWLNWAFQHQIGDYGEYIQHSTNYHRLMLQAALWVTSILNHEGHIWPATTSQALARSAHWLFSLLDSKSGKIPNLGANDGSLFLPLSVTPFNDYRSTVQAAARAFLRSELPAGIWDELSVWLGMTPNGKIHQSNDYLTDNLRGRDSWAYLRCSRFKSRLSHMDQLHLDLWWRGLNLTQDAGTYLYNAEPPWDNSLVSTHIHNTVSVDDRDQMTLAGRFLILDWVPAYSKTLIDPNPGVLQKVMAYHKGYRGVRHERIVTVFVDERWLVEDKLTTRHPHIYRLHWLLPDWEWRIEKREQRVEISLKSPHGWITLGLQTDPQFADLYSLVSLVRGGELIHGWTQADPTDGWVSPTYGQKVPALSVAVEVRSSQSIQFTSEFKFPK
jgi:hypothetical protein